MLITMVRTLCCFAGANAAPAGFEAATPEVLVNSAAAVPSGVAGPEAGGGGVDGGGVEVFSAGCERTVPGLSGTGVPVAGGVEFCWVASPGAAGWVCCAGSGDVAAGGTRVGSAGCSWLAGACCGAAAPALDAASMASTTIALTNRVSR